jgi:hypothetical protein
MLYCSEGSTLNLSTPYTLHIFEVPQLVRKLTLEIYVWRWKKMQHSYRKQKATPHLSDVGVDGRVIRKVDGEGVDWMHLAQDRDQWRAVVDTVTNLWVP